MASKFYLFAPNRWSDRFFLLMWVLANTLPCLVMWLLFKVGLPSYVGAGLTCVLVAVAQQLLLQSRMKGLYSWITLTLLGCILGIPSCLFFLYIGSLGFGLTVGVAQWTLLQRRVKQAYLWILGTMGGALLGTMPAYYIFISNNNISSRYLEDVLFGMAAVIEVASSVVTGIVLLRLLSQPKEVRAFQA